MSRDPRRAVDRIADPSHDEVAPFTGRAGRAEEAAMIMAGGVPVDGRRSLEELGVELRPVEETFADTIGYLRAIGRVPRPA